MSEDFDDNEIYELSQDVQNDFASSYRAEEEKNANAARVLIWVFGILLGLIFISVFASFLAA
jgi:hypothetical protein